MLTKKAKIQKMKKYNSIKKIFIGGGLLPDTYEFISHIARGMAQEVQIICDQRDLKNCEIKPKNIKTFIFKLYQIRLLYQLPVYFILIIKALLRNKKEHTFFEAQIYSSYYGVALIYSKDGQIVLPLSAKIQGFLAVIKSTIKFAILKNADVRVFIIAHMTYGARTLIAFCRLKNLNVFASASNTVFRLRQDIDDYPLIRPEDEINQLVSMVNARDVNEYWEKKVIGKSGNREWDLAAQGQKKLSQSANVVFLHIYRDSPFYFIDQRKIFRDYIQWVDETIRIVKKSNEKWIFKVHPAAHLWGEDSTAWINMWRKKHNLEKYPNIEFIVSGLSNYEAISNARRIVTFSGRAQLEAVAAGMRPITIVSSIIPRFSDNYFSPNNIQEYENLLLNKLPEGEKVDQRSQYIAKCLMFAQDNVYSLQRLSKTQRIYRGASIQEVRAVHTIVQKSVIENRDYFMHLGYLLDRRQIRICYQPTYLEGALSC